MRWQVAVWAAGGLWVSAAFLACVGDTPIATPDAQAPDSGGGGDAAMMGDAPPPPPPGDGGSEAGLCSDPLVGNTVGIPNGTVTGSILSPSGPLLAGDYKLTVVTAFFGPCFPAPCTPKPKFGDVVGGLRITSMGGGNFVIERRIEMQQSGLPKEIRLDRFDATFDALNRKLNVMRTCLGDDAGATDAGTAWTASVVLNDASPTGAVDIDMTDIELVQTQPDGGPAGNARTRFTFQKQ